VAPVHFSVEVRATLRPVRLPFHADDMDTVLFNLRGERTVHLVPPTHTPGLCISRPTDLRDGMRGVTSPVDPLLHGPEPRGCAVR
jgi:hypothetical protein